eukprot:scaffold34636_cov145-Skeletonema_dohrnii-CCMP3373.AAC.5
MKKLVCFEGSDGIFARMAESVPDVMDKLEQLFAKLYLREVDSKEGVMKVLKEPTDEDEFMSSIVGDILSAMKLAE